VRARVRDAAVVPPTELDYRLDEEARGRDPEADAPFRQYARQPSGRVFTREELSDISRICARHGIVAVTDDLRAHLVDGPTSASDRS
jgi:aspartate/methionine/tyrosine aminotransferase